MSPEMAEMFKRFCTEVLVEIEADKERAPLFKEAIDYNAVDTGSLPPADPAEFFRWMRGDETFEAFIDLDAPVTYANFLLTEYELYGPEGE